MRRNAEEIKGHTESTDITDILTLKGLELRSLDTSRNAIYDGESKCAGMRSKIKNVTQIALISQKEKFKNLNGWALRAYVIQV